MKTALSNREEVAHYWANQVQSEGRSGNMFFERDSIYSYGTHFEIARFVAHDVVLFTTRDHSVSTSGHKSITRQAIPANVKVFTVPSFSNHAGNIEYYALKIEDLKRQAARSRKYAEQRLCEAQAMIKEAQEYIKHFKLKSKELSAYDAESILSADVIEKLKEQEQTRLKRERELKKEKITIWIAGGAVNISSVSKVYLRVKDDTIQTSHGAEVPLDAAKVLYHALGKRDIKGYQIGHYTVIGYNDGVLQIGCHRIESDEINRIAKELNW